jgi:hypothetical protein
MILPAAAAAASAAAEAAWPVGTRSGGGSAGAGGGVGAGAGAGAGAAADEERRAEDSGDGVPTTEGARYLFFGVVAIRIAARCALHGGQGRRHKCEIAADGDLARRNRRFFRRHGSPQNAPNGPGSQSVSKS